MLAADSPPTATASSRGIIAIFHLQLSAPVDEDVLRAGLAVLVNAQTVDEPQIEIEWKGDELAVVRIDLEMMSESAGPIMVVLKADAAALHTAHGGALRLDLFRLRHSAFAHKRPITTGMSFSPIA